MSFSATVLHQKTILAEFKLILGEILGKGAFGQVMRARDSSGKSFVVKIGDAIETWKELNEKMPAEEEKQGIIAQARASVDREAMMINIVYGYPKQVYFEGIIPILFIKNLKANDFLIMNSEINVILFKQ